MSSLKLRASTQPMSLFPLVHFQPGRSLQACHLFPMIMPIPTPELASEKAWISIKVGGGQMVQMKVLERIFWHHHFRSLAMLLLG